MHKVNLYIEDGQRIKKYESHNMLLTLMLLSFTGFLKLIIKNSQKAKLVRKITDVSNKFFVSQLALSRYNLKTQLYQLYN